MVIFYLIDGRMKSLNSSVGNHKWPSKSPPSKEKIIIPTECTYGSIKNEINYAYEFTNIELREQFHNFNREQNDGSGFLVFVLILFLLLLLPLSIATVFQDIIHYEETQFVPRLITGLVLFMSSCGVLVCGVIIQINRTPSIREYLGHLLSRLCSSTTTQLELKTTSLTYCYLISQFQLYFIVVFIRRSFSLNCHIHTSPILAMFGGGRCYIPQDVGQFLSFNAFMMITVPMMLMASIPETPALWIWMNLVTCMAVYVITCVVQSIPHAIVTVFFWWIILLFVLRDLQIKKMLIFITTRRLREALIENDRIQTENHGNELRYMIANVAHDLKTPLSSFNSGVDYIQSTIQDCLSESLPSNSLLRERLLSINSCLHNIHNTNAFMLMTINRCIDYTKASKGLKLAPKYETINLLDTLELPLSCMHNIQSRIAIQLKNIPNSICSHIITDKQWLQENILCLLSNAVKYSAEGVITVSVSLAMSNSTEMECNLYHSESCSGLKSVKGCSSQGSSSNSSTNRSKQSKILPSTMFVTEHGQESMLCADVDDVISVSMESQVTQSNKKDRTSSINNHNETPYCDGMMLRFEIEDTGIGMTEESMQTLYSPFRQNQRLAGGTGLGLYSLSKRLDALNGSYGVQSRRDGKQGSLFWFAFPYRPDHGSANSVSEHVEIRPELRSSSPSELTVAPVLHLPLKFHDSFLSLNNPTGTPTYRQDNSEDQMTTKSVDGLNILLVDDTPTIIKMTTLMLRKMGHNITAAENGQLALNSIINKWEGVKEQYDVVLMDLQMPVMDGLEATRRLRNLEQESTENRMPRNIVLGVSANSDEETVEEALSAGVDGFLAKPFNAAIFTSTINAILSSQRKQ